jgi:flagellar biosynthesis protein FlhG
MTAHAAQPRADDPRAASLPDDQATRLRALVQDAVPVASPRPVAIRPVHQSPRPVPGPTLKLPNPTPNPAPNPAPPPIRHRTDLAPRRARIIALASGKGGVGKTSVCVNLAIALSALNKRTTLLDADLGLANADVLCGLSPTKRLEHVVGLGGAPSPAVPASMREIAIEAPGGFRLIPGAAGIARMADLDHHQRSRLLAGLVELERDSDLVLIDTAAGLARDVITFMQIADLGIILATPDPTSITDAYALIKCALTERPVAQRAHRLRDRADRAPERAVDRAAGLPPDPARQPLLPMSAQASPTPRLVLLVNQVVDQREAEAVHARIAKASARFLGYQLPLIGWIVQDARLAAAVRKRKPVLLDAPRSRASDDLRRLARAAARAVEPERSGAKPRRRALTRLLARIVLRNR